MEIRFIGNGSGFSKTNTNAYIIIDNDLYLIDCSMLNMNRIKEMFNFRKYKSINILVTHMHADHVSGIPNLIQHLFHMYNIKTNIYCHLNLMNDINRLNDICGVNKDYYSVKDAKSSNLSFVIDVVKTEHSNNLVNGSYGYIFKLNNKVCIYTGDTKNLNAFNKYINNCDELYMDVSYESVDAHININNFKKNIPNVKKIYLMHLDDEEKISESIKDLDNVEIFKI